MKFWLTAILLAGGLVLPARGDELLIAAAADMVYCLDALNAAFARQASNVTVKVVIGASGNLCAQIQQGAPYDVFLSADLQYPRQLVKAGLADELSLTHYAVGRLVLWTTRPDIPVEQGLPVVTSDAVRHVAIANPEHAPYGRAAKAALESEHLWSAVQPKLVVGENIAQAAQFVQSGNADVGIVALSLVLSPQLQGVGRYSAISPSAHPVLGQGAIITRQGMTNPASQRYIKFLRSPEARAILDRYGFRLS